MAARSCEFVSLADLMRLVREHVARVPRDVDLIVGIPRSGMIPAYAIALYRNLAVTTLAEFIERRSPRHGRTRFLAREIRDPFQAERILLVDDSCSSGGTLEHARTAICESGFTGSIVTCVPIVEPSAADKVDIWFAVVPPPRVFEWNVFHHHIIEEACVDFDGVLCSDPLDDENDDGLRYLEFLANARPLHVPTRPIGHIVSARLEKHRKASEEWLARQGIRYRHLHLLDLPSKAERLRTHAHSRHKCEIYRRVGAPLFIESDETQAAEIARSTGWPVLCARTMTMYRRTAPYVDGLYPYSGRGLTDILGAVADAPRKFLGFFRQRRWP